MKDIPTSPHSSKEIDFKGLPKSRHKLRLTVLQVIGWVLALLILVSAITYPISVELSATIAAFEVLSLYLLFPALGVVLIYFPLVTPRRFKVFTKQGKQERALIRVFAQHNNLLQGEKVALKPGSEPGSLLRLGVEQECRDVIGGEFMGLTYALYRHEYSLGSTYKYSWRFENTVMAFTLPRTLPQFIIDSRLYSKGNTQSGLPLLFDRSQEIKLEGTFSKYFRLYAPAEYQVPALSILTPDVMLAIMETGMECDIEIVGDKLYFYWPSMEPAAENYQAYYRVAEVVLKEVKRKLLSGDIYATEAQALHHSSLDPLSGVRLKPGFIARLSYGSLKLFWRVVLFTTLIIAFGFVLKTPSLFINELLERIATFVMWIALAGFGLLILSAYVIALRNALVQRRGIKLAGELRRYK